MREAWETTREAAPDTADGLAMEAQVQAFFDEVVPAMQRGAAG